MTRVCAIFKWNCFRHLPYSATYRCHLPVPLATPNIVNDLQEFFEFIEQERVKDLEALARKYRAIGPLLTKMEGLVAHTNTGKSPKLHRFVFFGLVFFHVLYSDNACKSFLASEYLLTLLTGPLHNTCFIY